jgi:hypothetical protein
MHDQRLRRTGTSGGVLTGVTGGGGVSSTNAAQRVDSQCSRRKMKPAQAAVKPSPTATKPITPATMYRL